MLDFLMLVIFAALVSMILLLAKWAEHTIGHEPKK